jgi:hypothetical protein
MVQERQYSTYTLVLLDDPEFLKFDVEVQKCNIPAFGVTKIKETDVCIAVMHRKSGKISRFQIKYATVTEVSLDLMELE